MYFNNLSSDKVYVCLKVSKVSRKQNGQLREHTLKTTGGKENEQSQKYAWKTEKLF